FIAFNLLYKLKKTFYKNSIIKFYKKQKKKKKKKRKIYKMTIAILRELCYNKLVWIFEYEKTLHIFHPLS
ncbi:MAG: hypothetical protein LUF89_00750, partial [Ruminococcus sp.]|nr:hypothetical protein [Ruminococcus sp.]